MRKRSIAVLLVLCFAFSLAACSSGGSGAAPQTQEPASAEGHEAPQASGETEKEVPAEGAEADLEPPDDVLAGMTDEQREKYEEYLELKEQKEEDDAAAEVNGYGITDEAMQALADAIKENVTNDYLNVYDISPADFSWPGAEAEFWAKTGSAMTLAVNVGQFFNLPGDVLFKDLPDEDTALAEALLSGIAEWEDTADERFFHIFEALSDENGLSTEKLAQFFADNVTFE